MNALLVILAISLIILIGLLIFLLRKLFCQPKKNASGYDMVFQSVMQTMDEDNELSAENIPEIGEIRGLTGEYKDQVITLKRGEEIIMGRDPSYCVLIFQNKQVSRKHCGIRYNPENGCYQAIDYSSNGTTLSDGTLLTTSDYTTVKPGTVLYMANGTESFQLG